MVVIFFLCVIFVVITNVVNWFFCFVFFIIVIDIIAIMIVNVSLFVIIVEPGLGLAIIIIIVFVVVNIIVFNDVVFVGGVVIVFISIRVRASYFCFYCCNVI